MTVMSSQAQQIDEANSVTKRLFNVAIFPVSAGAVGAEVVTVATKVVSVAHAHTAGFWAGIVCAAVALAFQIVTQKRS